ncbi:acetyltransferase [Erythrobacter sp. SCSIO 43205]|uniref:putative colanic acid biosynthesis acetyltransferase n=1 Tax=Erythrobacter sp. SCSIO 43205 TaxID=2779361 RepID=UPI001CA8D230|nr:putative colanic acid biosynthesis acetyltransferase [Erythrobacter sp. SCSIO 43205]UAB78975.1 acetyltransferase [Erythrobacter sp. SCSIO 43205]
MTDVASNRAATKWSTEAKIGRLLWAMCNPLFRLSPRPFWGWRRMLLRAFGAKVGADAHIYPTVRITIPWNLDIADGCAIGDHAILYALGPIRIGPRATVSQYAHLCAGTHDWRDPLMPLIKAQIVVGADAWVCADAFVGPGVTIGNGAIVGARAVAVRDVAANVVSAGNPAKKIGNRPIC